MPQIGGIDPVPQQAQGFYARILAGLGTMDFSAFLGINSVARYDVFFLVVMWLTGSRYVALHPV